MKKLLTIIFLFTGILVSKGQDLNSYKYVLVPEQFDFLKETDQFQLNSLTKFLFEKYGFEAFLASDEIPVELNQNRCDGLFAGVVNNSGLFRTRLVVTLKDCNNKIVYTSPEGVSAEKDYHRAYQEALRNAFENLESLNYNYRETIVSGRPELEKLNEEATLPENSSEKISAAQEVPIEIPADNVQEEKQVQESTAETSTLNFTKEGSLFHLEQTANGYSIFQKGMAEPFAALIKSSAGSNFIYSSINSKGMAHFDGEGNLVVEVLNPATGSLDAIIYKVQP